MKQLLLLMLVAVVALSACSESRMEDAAEPRSGITLQLNLPESSIVQTRAQSAAETALNNLWLFTFNSLGILEQKSKAVNIQNTTHTANVTIKEGVGLNLYACANVSAEEETKLDGLVVGSTTVADLKAIKNTTSPLTAPGLPMWGQLVGQTITAATTKVNMTLTRSCSRVDVVASGIADFTLSGIEKLLKTAGTAPIFPAGSLVAASSTADIVPTNKTLNSIYLYENAIVAADEAAAESKATAIIVKGTYKGIEGYYKLRVKYDTPTKYDIGRNIIYSMNITSVKAPGFATLEEAEASYPQNVDYTVTVSDGDAMDLTTSNGQYYLGVSNSEYIFCSQEIFSLVNVAVVTVTHNAPSSISDGTVTASGVGLTAKTTTISTSVQKQMILVQFDVGFSTGTLTLRLGNLMKVITLKRMPIISYAGGVFADYSASTYVQGDLEEGFPLWFKFGKSDKTAENTLRVQNPNGGLWIHVDPFFDDYISQRVAYAYVSSRDSKGRTRIDVQQQSAVLTFKNSPIPERITFNTTIGFQVLVNTDLPNWTVKAYEGAKGDKSKPLTLTLGTRFGNPVLGSPVVCEVVVFVPNNPGAERNIQLYLAAGDMPKSEIWFGTVVQEKAPASISVTPTSLLNTPYAGETYYVPVVSTHPWSVGGYSYGSTITPTSGVAGTTIVKIKVPANLELTPRSFNLMFTATNGAYKAMAILSITQNTSPAIPGSYIPTSVLAAAGWPVDRLPPVGLQVAMRGDKQLPGTGTPALADAKRQWYSSNIIMPGMRDSDRISLGILGEGKGNTNAILAAGNTNNTIAQYCQEMGAEWYVPCGVELKLIYENKETLTSPYAFPSTFYWTSSQDAAYGWILNFADGLGGTTLKVGSQLVRCVREI